MAETVAVGMTEQEDEYSALTVFAIIVDYKMKPATLAMASCSWATNTFCEFPRQLTAWDDGTMVLVAQQSFEHCLAYNTLRWFDSATVDVVEVWGPNSGAGELVECLMQCSSYSED